MEGSKVMLEDVLAGIAFVILVGMLAVIFAVM
jgi:hypothetical protein